jgi:hypothetical protein
MWIFSRLAKRRSTDPAVRSRTSTPPRVSFRPHLKVLEDRWMPSTLTVTNALDSNFKGSLRYEVAHANSKDTIVFAPSLDGRTITLIGSELDITKNLTIKGPGAGLLTVRSSYDPSGVPGSRVFEVDGANTTVTLSGLTISNGTGNASDGSSQGYNGWGGGVLNFGRLTISACSLSGNSAYHGGGIANFGALTVSACTLSGNYACTYGNPGGGGIYNAGTMAVSRSTVSGNVAGLGIVGFGGGIYNAGTLTVSNSVFSANGDNIFGPYTDGGGNTFS